MNQTSKTELLESARARVLEVQQEIASSLDKIRIEYVKGLESRKNLDGVDKIIQDGMLRHHKRQLEELALLKPSPFFVRCDVALGAHENQTLYFGKFSYPEREIYSWTTKAATMRFESPGLVSYIRPDGEKQTGDLARKDQYMIVDGKVMFFTTEMGRAPRELIYQEHFSTKKTGFILPEIVEQMEKAQDQVIRAPARGPLVISGPAGSGKTTLALHRVAYLAQAPDTAENFTTFSMVVFVQDNGTKEYFSHLLPELGIHNVTITTFAEWAFKILHEDSGVFFSRYGSTESEKDLYEWEKLGALKALRPPKYTKKHFAFLDECYVNRLSEKNQKLWSRQKKEKVLDRIDLTLILRALWAKQGSFEIEREYLEVKQTGEMSRKIKPFKVEYSLAVMDEFQNYLPEQLNLIKDCVRENNRAMLYVGDMKQQTRFGTVHDWAEIQESIDEKRFVTLQKVYRNTREILEYIRGLGYSVSIPEGARTGLPVTENICRDTAEEIEAIKKIITKNSDGTIGILAESQDYLSDFKHAFGEEKRVHMLGFHEAQGLEFDAVCLVGVGREKYSMDAMPEDFKREKSRIEKDLWYVALTRAVNELYVFGVAPLRGTI
ncbi:MAG: UvrD-helicase domain-containing protein [bacterium]